MDIVFLKKEVTIRILVFEESQLIYSSLKEEIYQRYWENIPFVLQGLNKSKT